MIGSLLQIIPCLTEEQVDEVVSLIDDSRWKPSIVYSGGKKTVVDNDIRMGKFITLKNKEAIFKTLHESFNRALIEYRVRLYHCVHNQYGKFPVPGSMNTSCECECIQLLKYDPDDYYRWHVDASHEKSFKSHTRTISIVLYLSDDFEGGGTEFPWGIYKPQKGEALVFPSNWCFPHQSQKLISGEKIAAVSWYHSYLTSNHEN